MTIEQIYKKAVEIGIRNDPRGKNEVAKILRAENEKFAKLTPEELELYDQDRLFNPYSDTRILFGSPETKVRSVILGIDMEAAEILLAYTLNKDRRQRIDLVIAHHPEGPALARLHDVMGLQTDLLTGFGVNVSVAERLMEKRISEIERRLLPVNHDRAVSAARVLGLPMMCIHTPADNCVTTYLARLFEREKPETLGGLVKILKEIREYRKSAAGGAAPSIVNGSDANRCGKIYVDMTGGTEGSKDIFDEQAAAGIATIVGMHMSEESLERAKKANLNVVIAGHIASDTLGLNLLFDELEKEEKIEFLGVSGFERIRPGDRPGSGKKRASARAGR